MASVKAALSYIFIPQIRVSHAVVEYGAEVNQTVKELLDLHYNETLLRQDRGMLELLRAQAQEVFAENERLSAALNLKPSKRWEGTWAKIAYREPTQWNTVIIDKGADDGVALRSAVIALENDQVGLAGVVVEVTPNTSKVLLVSDEDFSAVVYLEDTREEGLLVGHGARPVELKYIPLLSDVKEGERVLTAASSSIFPAGITVGRVQRIRSDESFQTALTIEITPLVRFSALKEVYVITSYQNRNSGGGQ